MEILHFAPSEMTGKSTVFTLSTSSDLKILVTEWFEGYVSESSDSEVSEDHPARFNSPRAPITEKAIFYVKRSVLAENNVWLAKEQDDTINLRIDEPYGIKGLCVWLAAFHGQSTPFSTMSIDDIWGAIKVGNINDFDRRKLQLWFEGWVARIRDEQPVKWNDVLFNRQLLFPCHFFDDAEGFKHLTRCLVYNTHCSSPIKESKPIKFNRWGLSPEFVTRESRYLQYFHCEEFET